MMNNTAQHGPARTDTRGWVRVCIAAVLLLAVCCVYAEDQPVTLRLARTLSREGAHEQAAIEFRRLALQTEEPAAYYWAAGREYLETGESQMALNMLDEAEERDPDLYEPAALLRAEAAHREEEEEEARFYYTSLFDRGTTHARRYAGRRLAVWDLRAGRPEDADQWLKNDATARDVLTAYNGRSKKSPAVGGVLGMIPGFGHFYSGEWANGARAMILNGLFIFGMAHSAEEEQWGAFAVISFFELTWYSGSIYGGIDAAHRYNHRLLRQAEKGIERDMRLEPDYDVLPAVRLNIVF